MLWKTVLYRASQHWGLRPVTKWVLESAQYKLYHSFKCRNLSTDIRLYGNHSYLQSFAFRSSSYKSSADRVCNTFLFCANLHYSNLNSEAVDGHRHLETTPSMDATVDKGVTSLNLESDSSTRDNVVDSLSSATQGTVASDIASQEVKSNWYDPVISYLTYLHDSTGMPWWGLIVTCTVVVRIVMLPFTLLAMRNAAIMNAIQPRLKEIQDLMFDAKSRGKLDQARHYQQEYMKVLKENDINPFRSMLGPLVQTPVFLAFFFGLRKMAETIPSFKTGGTSWFEDLSKPDPLFLMPTLCAGIFLLNLQLSLTTGATPTNKQWINVFRLFGLAIIPLTAKMPCAIFCYWIPSNLFSFLQNLVFSITSVRALLRLPPLPYKKSATRHEVESSTLQDSPSSSSWKTSHPSAVPNAAPVIGKKTHLKLYDKAPKHKNFSILLYRQQSQLWTSCQ
ncbi:hypothetical protein GpartN1_g600.t1 [Galdieria partita]|uniref:Membrane insertase YidC/Oxa/ALB C-terminal domain-containing protein n=1 Tax=Galdieria partita TaxID=83374 RepID=A0A9C7PRC9_9RHOD|nr:hypothetical protein GpartN1_g600.t1 [Galdieria partita]